jgi:uncharacterized protein YkwD
MRSVAMVRRGLTAALLVIAVLPAVASAASRSELSIVHAINHARARHHLPGLHLNRALARAAEAHSSEMARSGLMSHGAFEQRLRSYIHSRDVGENLAWARRCNAHRVVSMWMHSAPHRSVMLSRRFRKVGVGRSSTGSFCFVTADFASAR